jgi:Skp family chaperone for outer membrane proteins
VLVYKVGLDVGGLLANSSRGVAALKEIDRAMEEARKKGDHDLFGKLAYEKEKLQTGISGFQQDVKAFSNSAKYQEYTTLVSKGQDVSKFTNDREFMARLKSLEETNKALEKALNGVREAAEKGDFEQIQQANITAGQELDRFHHQTAGQTAMPGAGNAGLATFLNVQTAQQIVGAVTSGINTYVPHLDRSSIINRQGGGDVMGAQIKELHRSAAEKSQFWGSVGRIGGGILVLHEV